MGELYHQFTPSRASAPITLRCCWVEFYHFRYTALFTRLQLVEVVWCEWIERRENVIALGPSGTGKTHLAIGLGLAACQKGLSMGFTTAAALVSEMTEARDERRLLRFQKHMAGYKLFIIDELGFVLLSKTGAELLFELVSQRYERGSRQSPQTSVRTTSKMQDMLLGEENRTSHQ